MRRVLDMLHELRIWWAKECALSATEFAHARKLWREHARLIAQRSPAQVLRMEQRAGLI